MLARLYFTSTWTIKCLMVLFYSIWFKIRSPGWLLFKSNYSRCFWKIKMRRDNVLLGWISFVLNNFYWRLSSWSINLPSKTGNNSFFIEIQNNFNYLECLWWEIRLCLPDCLGHLPYKNRLVLIRRNLRNRQFQNLCALSWFHQIHLQCYDNKRIVKNVIHYQIQTSR